MVGLTTVLPPVTIVYINTINIIPADVNVVIGVIINVSPSTIIKLKKKLRFKKKPG